MAVLASEGMWKRFCLKPHRVSLMCWTSLRICTEMHHGALRRDLLQECDWVDGFVIFWHQIQLSWGHRSSGHEQYVWLWFYSLLPSLLPFFLPFFLPSPLLLPSFPFPTPFLTPSSSLLPFPHSFPPSLPLSLADYHKHLLKNDPSVIKFVLNFLSSGENNFLHIALWIMAQFSNGGEKDVTILIQTWDTSPPFVMSIISRGVAALGLKAHSSGLQRACFKLCYSL